MMDEDRLLEKIKLVKLKMKLLNGFFTVNGTADYPREIEKMKALDRQEEQLENKLKAIA